VSRRAIIHSVGTPVRPFVYLDVPAKLDTRAVFATITQRVVRKDVKLERHNIEDFLHTCVPVAHADAAFLDGKTDGPRRLQSHRPPIRRLRRSWTT
jgi:hypothetical protein